MSNPVSKSGCGAINQHCRTGIVPVSARGKGQLRTLVFRSRRIVDYLLHSSSSRHQVELAYRQADVLNRLSQVSSFEIPDTWSFVRIRHHLERFKQTVLSRRGHRCAFCGTRLTELLEVAHVSSYFTDVQNRANPANGIGLCAYCHRAFDAGLFTLGYDGTLSLIPTTVSDPGMQSHLSGLSREDRMHLLDGVNRELLRSRFAAYTPSAVKI